MSPLIYDYKPRLDYLGNKSKILILVPSPDSHGGISNYFEVIKPHFKLPVEYLIRGVRDQASIYSRIVYPILQISDYFYFIIKLLKGRYSFIQINTSLGRTSLIRDIFYIFILLIFKKKYIVFFRGIDYNVFSWVQNRWYGLFKLTFLKADGIILLSEKFRNDLERAGYKNKIFLETTVVNQSLLNETDIHYLIDKQGDNVLRVLFLSRIERSKGVYEAIDSIKILQTKGFKIQLEIYGDGSEIENIKLLLLDVPEKEIKLYGYVTGDKKIEAFSKAHLFLCPSYREGIPNSMLEAIAFGLPVITSNVGGIPDFFENGEMGYITDDISPKKLASLIEKLLIDCDRRKKMAEYNYYYAKDRFYTDAVVARLEKIYSQYING